MFLVILTNFGKDMTDKLRKMHQREKHILRSIFIPEKYVFRVYFESLFTRMISSLKYKCPRAFYTTLWLHLVCKSP